MGMKLTESVNLQSRDIDRKSISEILKIINDNDKMVALAVENQLENIAFATEAIVERLKRGGRLIYAGAGTSGRIGFMDAAECPPTYGIPEDRIVAVIAGGEKALIKAAENVEDNESEGREDMKKLCVCEKDAVVGLSASGRTPYARGALAISKETGAFTAAIICNKAGGVLDYADVSICLLLGPEVISGSTRMKAGSAQKMVLNMLSTAAMIRLGHVTGNFMTEMRPTNRKLRERAVFIVGNVCGVTADTAGKLLLKNDFNIKKTIHSLGRI
ncbi:MAG: N-acetylmuramic acid 6-phosphate etherase [Phycisphaerae bacterium]|jgi:N-acetylmuramic acid 6-phosphate etherase